MIGIEFIWFALWFCFGVIGAVRGPAKELGTSAILLLSLFSMKVGWEQIGSRIVAAVPGGLPEATVMAIYYMVGILFVAFIAYEGIVLQFPMAKPSGLLKTILGFFCGLLNGYLVVGTIWDVINNAKYFEASVPLGSTGQEIEIANTLTELHSVVVAYMPVTFANEFVLLVLGMILLLAIILK